MANTRRQLGELAVMARQTEDAERRILAMAEERLETIEGRIAHARVEALSGEADAATQYQDLIMERGRLHQVIAQARQVLGAN